MEKHDKAKPWLGILPPDDTIWIKNVAFNINVIRLWLPPQQSIDSRQMPSIYVDWLVSSLFQTDFIDWKWSYDHQTIVDQRDRGGAGRFFRRFNYHSCILSTVDRFMWWHLTGSSLITKTSCFQRLDDCNHIGHVHEFDLGHHYIRYSREPRLSARLWQHQWRYRQKLWWL